MQWQQETMIELLTNLPCKPFQHREIKNKVIFVERPLYFNQHAIIVAVQAFAFPAIGDKVG